MKKRGGWGWHRYRGRKNKKERERESLSKGLHKKRDYYTEGKYRGPYNSKQM